MDIIKPKQKKYVTQFPVDTIATQTSFTDFENLMFNYKVNPEQIANFLKRAPDDFFKQQNCWGMDIAMHVASYNAHHKLFLEPNLIREVFSKSSYPTTQKGETLAVMVADNNKSQQLNLNAEEFCALFRKIPKVFSKTAVTDLGTSIVQFNASQELNLDNTTIMEILESSDFLTSRVNGNHLGALIAANNKRQNLNLNNEQLITLFGKCQFAHTQKIVPLHPFSDVQDNQHLAAIISQWILFGQLDLTDTDYFQILQNSDLTIQDQQAYCLAHLLVQEKDIVYSAEELIEKFNIIENKENIEEHILKIDSPSMINQNYKKHPAQKRLESLVEKVFINHNLSLTTTVMVPKFL